MSDETKNNDSETRGAPTTKQRSSKISIAGEFFVFLKENKKWWLIPIITIFLLLGVLIVITSQSAIAPFLYPLF